MNTLSIDQLKDQLRRLMPLLLERYQVGSLEVFGSFVRGEEHKGSDLDVLVTFTKTPTLFMFIELENYLSDELGLKVDLVMKDTLKKNLAQRILAEAQKI